MIRHINEDEIKNLKKGLIELIRVKKILCMEDTIKKYYDLSLPVEKAKEVYKTINSCELMKSKYHSLDVIQEKYIMMDKTVIDFINLSLSPDKAKEVYEELNSMRFMRKKYITFDDAIIKYLTKEDTSYAAIGEFFELTLSLDKAIEVYNQLISMSYKSRPYILVNEVMKEYLVKNNVLNESLTKILEDVSFDRNKLLTLTDEEYERYEDEFIENDLYEIQDNIEELFNIIAGNLNVEVKSKVYSEILLGDVMDEDYKYFHKVAEDNIGEMFDDEEDKYTAFWDTFNDDARVFLFKNFKVSEVFQENIYDKLPNSEGGILTELFCDEDNTYFILADSTIFRSISNEVLLMIINELIEQKGR